LLSSGDTFTPLVVVENGARGAAALCALQRLGEEAGCGMVSVSAVGEEFLGSLPEEELTEKLLALREAGGDRAVRRVARRLKAHRSASAFENDQAVLIHRKERVQRHELVLDLLTALTVHRPLLIVVENGEEIEAPFREFLLYLGRSMAGRQQDLKREEPWPRAAFAVLGKPAAFPAAPFLVHVKAKPVPERQAERSDELTEAQQVILSCLAVNPGPLAVSRLNEVAGLGRRTFARALETVCTGGLVIAYGSTVDVASARTRRDLRARLTAERRVEFSRRLADSFAGRDEHTALRAYHLFSAGQKERGLAEALRAVEQYRSSGMAGRAEAILRYVLENFGEDLLPDKLFRLRQDLADILSLRGDHQRARELLRENWRFCRERGQGRAAARIQVKLGILAANLDRSDEALRELEAAASVLAASPEETEHYLRLQISLARVLLEKSAYERALAVAEEAVAFMRRHFRNTAAWRRLKALTYSRLGNIHAAVSDFPRALAAYEACAGAFDSFPDSLEKGGFYCNLARLYMTVADYGPARRYYQAAARIARSLGARELLGLTEINLGLLALYQWDLEEAEAHILTGTALSERAGSPRFVTFGRMCLANLRCRQGSHDESLRMFTAEKAAARKAGDRYIFMNVCLQSVYPRMELGEWRKAQRAARDGARTAKELAWPYGILEGELTQGQLAAALLLWDQAEEHLRRAREAPWGHHGHVDAELDYLEGQIAAGTGDLEAGVDAYRRAAGSFRRLKVWVYAVRSRIREAEALLRLGRRAEARRLSSRTWRTIAARPPAQRPPIIWFPAVLLRAELLLAEGIAGKADRRACFYELIEALARTRELRATPYLWRLLEALGSLCRRHRDRARAEKFTAEAAAAFDEYLRAVPKATRPRLFMTPAAERLAELSRTLLGKRLGATGNDRRDRRVAPGPRRRGQPRTELRGMVGTSPAMQAVYALIERVAPSDLPVLVSGESGTGKELAARAIHGLSARRDGPFVSENCAAIPESLAEAELFGYVRGAFTGAEEDRAGRIETASGGTLLLDEIGDLPLSVQAALLRVLATGAVRRLGDVEERPVDVRLIAATARDLRAEIERGAFRADLFYRLLGVEIRLPPLRDRGEDILLLAEHFFRASLPAGTALPRLTARARQALLTHAWPGNVRELENEVQRLAVLASSTVDRRDLRIGSGGPGTAVLPPGLARRYSLAEVQALVEREYLKQAIEECGGTIARVAKLLGVNRRSVYKMMRRLGLPG
jgi:DNA-binding NtrC family response regulator/tetratricopeptide (TPR) repeat protein